MYLYVLSVVIAWIIIKFVGLVWNYAQTCRRVASIPKLYPQHFFWDYMYKARTIDELIKVSVDYVRQKKTKWFTGWNMCFYPVVFPADPTTIKEVMMATNVPKNKGITGAYRMYLPWIGDGLIVSSGWKWERSRNLLTPAFHFQILEGYISQFNATVDIFLVSIRDGLIVSSGWKWERSRNLLTPAFHFQILEGYISQFNATVDIFLDKLANLSKSGKSFDVFPPVSRTTLDAMLRCSVSYKDDSVQSTEGTHPYVAAVNRLTYLLMQRWMTPLYYPDWIFGLSAAGTEFHALCDYVHAFSGDIIARRRRTLEKNPEASKKRHLDFLDILLTAKDSDGQGLSDLDIRNEVDTFLFAGHDTTASGISWTLNALAKYPTMQNKVRQEVEAILNGRTDIDQEDLPKLQYTTCFIKECQRMYPPVPMSERQLCQPLVINGVTFKPGQVIFLFYYMIHHNPNVWEDPEKFMPERFLPDNIKDKDPYAFVPFSAGQRNCIGQHFAMDEIKVTIAKVVTRFDISVDPPKTS